MNKFEKLIQKNQLYFGLDMLQIYLNKEDIIFFDDLVFNIDNDNTTSANIQLSGISLHYYKKYTSGYDYTFKFDFIQDNKIIDFFSLSFIRETKKIKSKVVLDIFSQTLTLFENNNLIFNLYDFLKENFKIKDFLNYRRLDFCLDLSLEKKDIIPFFKSFKSKIGKDKTGFYETYYTRDVNNEKNQRLLTRIYDKKLDTFKKQKGFLYNHLDNDFVSRIETEIRPLYCKAFRITLKDILENKEIKKNLFFQFLNTDLKEDFNIKSENIIFYFKNTEKYDLSFNFQKIGFIPKSYLQYANGYVKNIFEQTGYNGFLQLLLGVYFDDEKRVLRTYDNRLNYLCDRRPDELLKNLVLYYKNVLHIPQSKINSILRPLISNKIKLGH